MSIFKKAQFKDKNTNQTMTLDVGVDGKNVETGEDIVNKFSAAGTRENIKSGEKQSVLFGKIMKWLADMGAAAFYGVANNLLTTVAGYVLDARQGKILQDQIDQLNTGMLKLLWENPAPESDFKAQNIALSDGSYNMLLIIAYIGSNMYTHQIIPRYSGTCLTYVSPYSNSGGYSINSRRVQYASGNTYFFYDGQQTNGDAEITYTQTIPRMLVPHKIYGFNAPD